MDTYIYKLKDESGKTLFGFAEAKDKKELRYKLRDARYYFIAAYPYSREKILKMRVTADSLLMFTRRLSSLVESGIPILTTFYILWRQSEDKTIQLVVSHIRNKLEQGKTISEGLRDFPNVFSSIYCAMVAVAEKAGGLVEVLKRLTEHLEYQKQITTKTKKAAIYPSIIITVSTLVLICMFTFVVPIFQKILVKLKIELPLLTKIILGISEFIRSWYFLIGIIALGLGGYGLYRMLKRNPKYAYYADYYKLKIPFIGHILYSMSLSRFVHSLHILIGSGVPIVESFRIAKSIASNERIIGGIDQVRDRIEKGVSLYDAFKGIKIFPVMLTEMIGAAESSGRMTNILGHLAKHFDEEVDYSQTKFFTIIEPALILFVGGIVLVTMLSIYLPVFSIWQGLIAAG